MYRVTQEGWISSSHQTVAADGSLEPLHGHNWRIQVSVEAAELDERGMVVDLDVLRRALDEFLDGLDHAHLNDLPAFADQPVSAEVIARHVGKTLGGQLDDGRRRVVEVRVWMTDARNAAWIAG
jgi:6-pyruvoyltetrahydropterin/6-carboxytetrahydropterin synthase